MWGCGSQPLADWGVVGDGKVDDLVWVVPPSEPAAAVCVSSPPRFSLAIVMSAFQSAQPRPRSQVAWSRCRPRRNTVALSPAKKGPCHDKVAGCVADGSASEVDDRVQRSVCDEQV
jgi:hypothetical protein